VPPPRDEAALFLETEGTTKTYDFQRSPTSASYPPLIAWAPPPSTHSRRARGLINSRCDSLKRWTEMGAANQPSPPSGLSECASVARPSPRGGARSAGPGDLPLRPHPPLLSSPPLITRGVHKFFITRALALNNLLGRLRERLSLAAPHYAK
jgi:hypothetical protein